MASHANIAMYFFQAGWVVKSVMLLLVCASLITWTLIFQRAWFFREKKAQMDVFERRFWDCGDLSKLYADLDSRPDEKQGMATLFHAGFKAFLRESKIDTIILEPIQRMMHIAQAKETEAMELYLPFFASVGSIATYVGLFGTVWGIMTSLQALGSAKQATIAMVAPGISEALVATALGLFTAIPAVLAYNRYTARVSTLLSRYDRFQEELISLIEQQRGELGKGLRYD